MISFSCGEKFTMYLTCVLEHPLAVEVPLKMQQKKQYFHRTTHFTSEKYYCLKYLLSFTSSEQSLLYQQWQLRLRPVQPDFVLLLLILLDLQSKFHILVLGLTKYSNISKQFLITCECLIVFANIKATHRLALLTLKDFRYFEESNNWLFAVLDESPSPPDGPCHWRLVFSYI